MTPEMRRRWGHVYMDRTRTGRAIEFALEHTWPGSERNEIRATCDSHTCMSAPSASTPAAGVRVKVALTVGTNKMRTEKVLTDRTKKKLEKKHKTSVTTSRRRS